MMEEKTSQDYINEFFGMTEEPCRKEISQITEFHNGCNIFITGGSGFMGKLLIEKYLRCCPKMGKLFMLMRPKKKKSIEERIEEHFNDPLYDVLKRDRPNFRKQVQVIEGDTGASDLGISDENRKLLIDETHIVLHGAACMRFDGKLRSSIEINIRGTQLMLLLAKNMKNLKAFVHISTAFSNCTQELIDEIHYDPPMECDKVLDLIQLLDDAELEVLTPTLIGEFPNMYAFSKAVAEDTVQNYGADIPCCIVRPSIVISTDIEPTAGWINNIYGPLGYASGIGIGLIRTIYCKTEKLADMIPADYATSNIVAAAWDTAKTWEKEKLEKRSNVEEKIFRRDPVIFNNVSSCQNPMIWGKYINVNMAHSHESPSIYGLWYRSLICCRSEWSNKIAQFCLHLVPAVIVDCACLLIGRKPILLDAYKKIHKFSEVVSYFGINQWTFKNDNNMKIWDKMNATDRVMYNFNVTNLDWDEYFDRMVRGIRLYLYKDTIDTLEAGRKKYFRLKIAHYSLVSLLSVLVIWATLKLLLFIVSSIINF